MKDAMEVDTGHPKSNAHSNGHQCMPEERMAESGHASSTMDGHARNQRSRPTRESVLERLSEALLRRSLTKVRYMIVHAMCGYNLQL